MDEVKPIRLADEPSFELARIAVAPAARTIATGPIVTTIEPRTMQVLVLLARQPGQVVGRQTLIDACWDGRIVGEDAINRAILKLRRALEDIGADISIETVSRVGYRLSGQDADPDGVDAVPVPDRRRILLAGAAIGTAALGIGYVAWPSRPNRPARAQEYYERGEAAFQQGSRDDNAQAVGFFEQAAALAPHDAAIAGALALSYRFEQTFLGPAMLARATIRADRATARALLLDPRDPNGVAAKSIYVPFGNHWGETERRLRAGLRIVPGSGVMNGFLGIDYHAVGRMRDAIRQFDKAMDDARFVPLLRSYLVDSLFAAGRIGDADRELDAAVALWPRFANLWWARFWIFALTGRLDAVRAHLSSTAGLPIGIGPSELEAARRAITAIETRTPAAIDIASRAWRELAHSNTSFTIEAIGLTATLGRGTEALAMAEAYLAPLLVGRSDFGPGPGFLFGPAMASVHREPAFWSLCERIGLGTYWRTSGSRPDLATAAAH